MTDKIQISKHSTGLLFTLLGKSNLSIFDNDFELKQQSQTLSFEKLKPFEDKEETWEESKSLINTVGTKFILFEGKKYYQENNKTHQ